MNIDRIKEIESRLKAATPGPWESRMLGGGKGGPNHYSVRASNDSSNSADIARVHPKQNASTVEVMFSGGWNARLISNAPTDLLYLLDELASTRAKLEAAENVVEDARSTLVCLTHCDMKQLQKVQGPHWDYIIGCLSKNIDDYDAQTNV